MLQSQWTGFHSKRQDKLNCRWLYTKWSLGRQNHSTWKGLRRSGRKDGSWAGPGRKGRTAAALGNEGLCLSKGKVSAEVNSIRHGKKPLQTVEPKWTDAVNCLQYANKALSWLENCEKTGRERILIMQRIHVDNIYNHTCSEPVLSTYAFLKDFT